LRLPGHNLKFRDGLYILAAQHTNRGLGGSE